MSELKRFSEGVMQIANSEENKDNAIRTKDEVIALRDFLLENGDSTILKYWNHIATTSLKNNGDSQDVKTILEFNINAMKVMLKKYSNAGERSLTKQEMNALSTLFDGMIGDAGDFQELKLQYKQELQNSYAGLVESMPLHDYAQSIDSGDYIDEGLRKQNRVVKKLFYHDDGVIFTDTGGNVVSFKEIKDTTIREQIAEVVDQGMLVNLSSFFRVISAHQSDFDAKEPEAFWDDATLTKYQYQGKKLDKKEKAAMLTLSKVVKESTTGYVKQTIDSLRNIALMPVTEQRDSQTRALRRYYLTKKRLQENGQIHSVDELENVVFDLNLDNSLDDALTMSEPQLAAVFGRAYTANGGAEAGKRKTWNNLLGYLKQKASFYTYGTLEAANLGTNIQSCVDEQNNDTFYETLGELMSNHPVLLSGMQAELTTFNGQKIFDILMSGEETAAKVAEQYEDQETINALRKESQLKVIAEALDQEFAGLHEGVEKTINSLDATDPRRELLQAQLSAVEKLSAGEKKRIVFQLHGLFGVLTDHQGKTLLSGIGTSGGVTIDLRNNVAQYLDINLGLLQGNEGAKEKGVDLGTSGVLSVGVRSAYLAGKKKNVTLFRGVSGSAGVNRTKTSVPVGTTLSPQSLLLWGSDVTATVGASFIINGDRMDGLGGTSAKSIALGVSVGRSLTQGTTSLSVGASLQDDRKTGIEREHLALQDLMPALLAAVAGKTMEFDAMYTVIEQIFLGVHPKIAKKMTKRNFKAGLEQLTTLIFMKLPTYQEAYKELTAQNKSTQFLVDEFVSSIVNDCRNLSVEELGDGIQSLHVSGVGVGVMILPTPAAVGGVTMSRYGETTLQNNAESVDQSHKKLESGAMVHQLTGTLADNITTYNNIINNTDGNTQEVLTEENKLQKVTIGNNTYCAIPKGFADRVTVWNAFGDSSLSGMKAFCPRYMVGDQEMMLIPSKAITSLHVLQEAQGARFVFVVGDRGVQDIGEFYGRKQFIDSSTNRALLPEAKDEKEALQVLDSYDIDVMWAMEKKTYEAKYMTELATQIATLTNQDPTYPIESVVSLELLEKPLTSTEPPSNAEVIYKIKDAAKSNFDTISVWPAGVVYDKNTGQLTVQLPATLNLFKANNDGYKVTYEKGTSWSLGYASVENFASTEQTSEQMVSAELPQQFLGFLSSDHASALWMKIRYDNKLTLNTDAEETGTLYEDYHKAIEKGNYAEAKKIIQPVFQEYMTSFDPTISVDSWLDLTANKGEQAIAVLHQIDGELSRVWHTEYKHETAAEAKTHATTLLAELGYAENGVLRKAVMAVMDAPAGSRVAMFEQHRQTFVRELRMQYGKNGYNPSLLQRDKKRFMLGHLIRPDYDIMEMRDDAFVARIHNSPGYEGQLGDLDILLRQQVKEKTKQEDAMFAPESKIASGAGERQEGNMALVETYHGSRVTGHIGWKPVYNPTLVPGSEVSIDTIITNEQLNDAYKRQFLRDKYEGKQQLIDFEVTNIWKQRQAIIDAHPGKEVIFKRDESNLPKGEVTIEQLIAFKMNPLWNTLVVEVGAFGPCKNYCKKEKSSLPYAVRTMTELKTDPVPVTVIAVPRMNTAAVGVYDQSSVASRTQSNFTAGVVITKGAPEPEESESSTNPDEEFIGTTIGVEPGDSDGLVFDHVIKTELGLPDIETTPGTFIPQTVDATAVGVYTVGGKEFEGFFRKDNNTGVEGFYVTAGVNAGANLGTQTLTDSGAVLASAAGVIRNHLDMLRATNPTEMKRKARKMKKKKKESSDN